MMERLPAAGYQKMPWKNGAGYTLELIRHGGTGLNDFDWRVSMADVKSAGDFSKFEGMQRILTVLDGAGLVLNIAATAPQRLNRLQSVAFSGTDQVSCELVDGAIRDFNLIFNPLKYQVRYQWLDVHAPVEILSSADVMFVFHAGQEKLQISRDGQQLSLNHHDSVHIEKTGLLTSLVLSALNITSCCVIELTKK